ncbi:hypothetical protein CDD81_1066 [Ophiocordyceps australis]|uniref:Uncharacterized protein n=1 Tax=Ophiocordyceps australis TaxID=1399860 RepID=A0A2C5XUH2_9HYPO|nr:hypothetical protein CDD81_1066 [Ophiocordyceps australis]
MTSRPSNGAATATRHPRFELPALDLNFGSITDGTNIPPPPASPVQKVPTPPQTPPADDKKKSVKAAEAAAEAAAVADVAAAPATSTDAEAEPDKPDVPASPPNGNHTVVKQPLHQPPLSPAASGRQASIRQLFRRNMLNGSFAEGRLMSMGSASLANMARPDSRGTASIMEDRKSRRNSGWFRRLRGGESRRSSLIFEDIPEPPVPVKPAGPPPPMIPELVDLEKDEGSLGRDLFKNIK